jgi:hypothetical protein
MKASSVSVAWNTGHPIAALLKVKVNYGYTRTIAGTARFLFGLGRAALPDAQAGALDGSGAGVGAPSGRYVCALMLGAAGSPVPGASPLSGRSKAFFL